MNTDKLIEKAHFAKAHEPEATTLDFVRAGFIAGLGAAKLKAIEASRHHFNHCVESCKCSDGWHIAMAIDSLIKEAGK